MLRPISKTRISSCPKLKDLSSSQLESQVIFSLDVVSLYTNVNTQEAFDISAELLRNTNRRSVWGIPMDSILEILAFILRANTFHITDAAFYNQVRGLAIG